MASARFSRYVSTLMANRLQLSLSNSSPSLQRGVGLGLALLIGGALLLVGLSSFGVWDPWELAVADAARGLPVERTVPWFNRAVSGLAFSWFGIGEAAGRMPYVLFGLIAIAATFELARRLAASALAGFFSGLALSTMGLFLFLSRPMFGSSAAFAAQALTALGLVMLLELSASAPNKTEKIIGASLAILGTALGVVSSGVLAGVLPVWLAAGAVIISRQGFSFSTLPHRVGAAVVMIAVVLGVMTAFAVITDADQLSFWTGGRPQPGNPPTFEKAVEYLFHGLMPWSAVVPVALIWLFGQFNDTSADKADEATEGSDAKQESSEAPLQTSAHGAMFVGLWALLGLGATTLFNARYGGAAYLALPALAIACGLMLHHLEREKAARPALGIAAVLLLGLLIRDLSKYPKSTVAGLGLDNLNIPDDFQTGSLKWLLPFGAGLVLLTFFDRSLKATSLKETLDIRPVVRTYLIEPWHRGWTWRLWILGLVFVASLLFVVGAVGWALIITGASASDGFVFHASSVLSPQNALRIAAVIAGLAGLELIFSVYVSFSKSAQTSPKSKRLSSLAQLSCAILLGTATGLLVAEGDLTSLFYRGAAFGGPLLIPYVVLGALSLRLTSWALRRFPAIAPAALVVGSLIAAGWVSFSYLPRVSAALSPREVYETYNEQTRGRAEPLAEYNVSGRAGAYYGRGRVQAPIANEADAITYLSRPERVWLVFPTDNLAALDRAYRATHDRHLYIADARSARLLLATNQPVASRPNQNFLAEIVLDRDPTPQFRSGINFDRRVELIGYDLDLPSRNAVGPGQRFTVTWYWRCIAPMPAGYQLFLHVDGFGQRLNGDHDPADPDGKDGPNPSRYPLRLWEPGNIVVDRQELFVPANFPAGNYTFYMGFYQGESRLDIVAGPEESGGSNRGAAGTLRIQ